MSREMKNSGIKWIGEIPKEWKVMKIKHYCKTIFAGGTPQSNNEDYWDGDIPWIPSGSCKNGIIDSAPKHITKQGLENSSTKLIPSDTTVMAMTGATCSNVGYVTFDTCMNQSVVAYIEKKDKAQSKFLFYLLQGAQEEILIHKTGGAQSGINVEDCKNIIVPCINLSTQQRISDYLDKICGEIDGMIALQEKMIEELKAYKQSVITEAVTKGLNPNVPMRDSGIDWIGEIPEHWAIRRLKFICDIQTGNQDTQDAIQDGKYPFYVRSPKVEHSIKYSFEGEGILMAGDGAGAGRVFHHAFGKYAVHQRVYRLSSFKDINTHYLFHYISNLFCKVMDMGSAQSTVPSVRLPMLLNFIVCMPPLIEQNVIASFLDTKCSEIDSLITIKQEKIDFLKEYKKSIIYEYVTGKKQVN